MSYTVAQAARLAGCTASQLRHWSRSGLVVASLALVLPFAGPPAGAEVSAVRISHGYGVLDVRRESAQMDWYFISDRTKKDATASRAASFVTASGSQKLKRV